MKMTYSSSKTSYGWAVRYNLTLKIISVDGKYFKKEIIINVLPLRKNLSNATVIETTNELE